MKKGQTITYLVIIILLLSSCYKEISIAPSDNTKNSSMNSISNTESTTSAITSSETSSIVQGRFIKIAAGGDHTVALAQDGSVWTWGCNNYGQLGNGVDLDEQDKDSYTPIKIIESGVKGIAAGASYSLVIRDYFKT